MSFLHGGVVVVLVGARMQQTSRFTGAGLSPHTEVTDSQGMAKMTQTWRAKFPASMNKHRHL